MIIERGMIHRKLYGNSSLALNKVEQTEDGIIVIESLAHVDGDKEGTKVEIASKEKVKTLAFPLGFSRSELEADDITVEIVAVGGLKFVEADVLDFINTSGVEEGFAVVTCEEPFSPHGMYDVHVSLVDAMSEFGTLEATAQPEVMQLYFKERDDV